MNYRNAWNCKRCPQSHGENGCPAWVEYMQTNTVTGEERLEKTCLFQALPVFLVEVIKASNRPAAVMENARNEIVNGFAHLAQAVALPALIHGQEHQSLDPE